MIRRIEDPGVIHRVKRSATGPDKHASVRPDIVFCGPTAQCRQLKCIPRVMTQDVVQTLQYVCSATWFWTGGVSKQVKMLHIEPSQLII